MKTVIKTRLLMLLLKLNSLKKKKKEGNIFDKDRLNSAGFLTVLLFFQED